MKTLLFFLFPFLSLCQLPSIDWQKCYGGSGIESPAHLELTPDGGSIICGTTQSIDGDINTPLGSWDGWVVKLDASGAIEWEKCLGGSGHDNAYYVINASDGGYIVCCHVSSNDGQVTGNHGGSDVWLVKLSSNGVVEWQKTYGGSSYDRANVIKPTSDGGYIFCGDTGSSDGDVLGHIAFNDVWVVKIDYLGNIEWEKCYGGNNNDHGTSIDHAIGGGYIIGAYTNSTNGNVTGYHGGLGFDGWILKIDSFGSLLWQNTIGGSSTDYIHNVKQLSDNGYLISGNTESSDGDVSSNHGGIDAWVVKTNSFGSIIWEKNFGGSNDDYLSYSIEKVNGEIILAGNTKSNDIEVTGNHGQTDAWIVSVNQSGSLVWQKCFGGSSYDGSSKMHETSDGYLLFGSASSNDGDVTGGHGSSDLWLVKLAEPADIDELNVTKKQLLRITDLTGRETLYIPNTPLIYIYSDGTIERVFEIKE